MAQPTTHPPQQPATHSPPPTTPSSLTSTPLSKPTGTSTPLSLSLSSLPPLLTPSPPSNTLLITGLNSTTTFSAPTLQKIRSLLSTPTPLNSFSPLRSFHRIIVSYPTTAAAIAMRQSLEKTTTFAFGSSEEGDQDAQPMRIYFGEHTPVAGVDAEEDQHLHPPSLGKLLFISPPPSPPMGWEIREEEPPNRDVHAEDLQRALAGLGAHAQASYTEDDEEAARQCDGNGEMSDEEKESLQQFEHGGFSFDKGSKGRKRTGTGSLMVYHPKDHGGKEDLPKVMVEDTEGGDVTRDLDGGGAKMLTQTARPPVELMGSE